MLRYKAVTIGDVARASKCSCATVSVVLNRAPLSRRLSVEMRERVRQCAQQLGYRPNPWARVLHGERSNLLGVLVNDMAEPLCGLVLRGIQDLLQGRNYLPLIIDLHESIRHCGRHVQFLLDRRVEGLIAVATVGLVEKQLLAAIRCSRVPTVIVGSMVEDDQLATVFPDDEGGARSALKFLHRLGHRDIAFIRGPDSLPSSKKRWRAIRSFAREAGIELQQERIVDLGRTLHPDSNFEVGVRRTSELVRRGRPFTALMTFDDMTALGAVKALKGLGIGVPEECSVLGFGDVPLARLSAPALSTVRQPMESMGTIAAETLLSAIDNENRRKEISAIRRRVPTELVIRESTRPISVIGRRDVRFSFARAAVAPKGKVSTCQAALPSA